MTTVIVTVTVARARTNGDVLMCRSCETDAALEDCAFDADEHHPNEWPSDATREDYPEHLPEPMGWHDDSGKPYDSNWRRYSPYQGSQTPTEGRCNTPLSAWEDRYGEVRYCMRLPEREFGGDSGDSDFCHVHKTREQLMERASDLFTHGLYSKTIRHTFDKLSSWQQLVTLAFYDSYTQESEFSFDASMQDFQLDFTEAAQVDELPLELQAMVAETDTLSVDVPIPQEHEVRGFALYRVALMDMKTVLAERAVLPDEDEDTTAMERTEVVGVTDDGRVIEDETEHHLNIPISRVDDSRDDLLAFGGVPIDGGDVDLEDTDAEAVGDLIVNLGDDSPSMKEDPAEEASNPVESALEDEDSE